MLFKSLVFSIVKIYSRRTFSTPARKPPYVDLNKKLIYGGDLSTPPFEESFGSLLFKRMIQMDRRDRIFQWVFHWTLTASVSFRYFAVVSWRITIIHGIGICAKTGLKMTTGEFLKSSVAVAQGMKEKGVEKGDYVFLLGQNSLNINIVLVAALLIAAVPFPISFKIALEKFQNLLKGMQPKFFWCEKSYLYAFHTAALETGKLDPGNIFVLNQGSEVGSQGLEDFTRGKGEDFENFQPTKIEDCREELALALNAITYGGPDRTVGLTHYNLNSVIANYDDLGYGNDYCEKVFLMVQKVFWISGIYPLLLSCAYGSTIIIMHTFREDNFLKYIEHYQVTDVHLYPSKWWTLFKYKPVESYNLSSCKWPYVVNETVSQALREGLKEKYGLNLRFTYVLSEMSGMIFKCDLEDVEKSGVGKLFPELYAKVVSFSTSRPNEPNVHGELCFKGPTMSKGYIKNKKATKQLFDRDGFLLSGYCGYYEESGNFYVIDRIVHQIQYKEHKISPKDIEGVILSHPGVKDVCVTSISHKRDGAYPLALVVLQRGEKITEEEIAAYVNEKVPDHKKLRGGVVFLSKIPRFRETGTIKRSFLQKVLSNYQVKDKSDAATSEQYKPPADKG